MGSITSEDVAGLTTIPVADDRGRKVYSHALRVCCCSWMSMDARSYDGIDFVRCSTESQAEDDERGFDLRHLKSFSEIEKRCIA